MLVSSSLLFNVSHVNYNKTDNTFSHIVDLENLFLPSEAVTFQVKYKGWNLIVLKNMQLNPFKNKIKPRRVGHSIRICCKKISVKAVAMIKL